MQSISIYLIATSPAVGDVWTKRFSNGEVERTPARVHNKLITHAANGALRPTAAPSIHTNTETIRQFRTMAMVAKTTDTQKNPCAESQLGGVYRPTSFARARVLEHLSISGGVGAPSPSPVTSYCQIGVITSCERILTNGANFFSTICFAVCVCVC